MQGTTTETESSAIPTGDQSAEIAIRKGVPLPRRNGGGRGNAKYPWHEMEVGDSFVFPAGVTRGTNYRAAFAANERYAPKKFATRSTPEGFCCWRIA